MNSNRKSVIFGSEQSYLSDNYEFKNSTICFLFKQIKHFYSVGLSVFSNYKKQVFNLKLSIPYSDLTTI